MATKIEFIVLHESTLQSWMRDASVLALLVGLVGIGWLLDSSALQWIGAIMGFITICTRAKPGVHRVDLAGARAVLDKIERDAQGDDGAEG